MPMYAELEDGRRLEFPDGTDPAVIQQTVRRMIAAQPARQPQAPNPADGIGAMQAGLIGAGRTTDKMIQGVRQLYNKAIGDDATLGAMAADEAEKDRLFAPLRHARPVATSIGESAPMLAIPAGGGTAAAFMGRSALAGAIPGLLSYGEPEDRLRAGAVGGIGGAIGGGIGLGVARALKPGGVAVAGISDDAAAAADRLGIRLTAGQQSQNPALVNLENYFARAPGSSGAMQARQQAQQAALNSAAAKAIGQSGGDLSEGTFSAARAGIGSEFERLQAITNPKVGNDFLNALARIDADNLARGSFRSKSVDSLVDKGIDLAAQGNLTGKAYKEIRTVLTNDANAAFKSGDATLGQALKTVRGALDDAAKESLSEADQKAWEITRAQWKAYKALTKSNIAEAGNVSAARLAAELRRGGDGFRTGAMQGGMSDIGRFGEAVKGAQNPNSGQLVQQMLYGNPITGLPMMAANKAAQSAYTAPWIEKYIGRGLLDLGPDERLLLGRLAGPTGAPFAETWLGSE